MKGVIHLAAASIINALWDLWARIEGKVSRRTYFQDEYESFDHYDIIYGN